MKMLTEAGKGVENGLEGHLENKRPILKTIKACLLFANVLEGGGIETCSVMKWI